MAAKLTRVAVVAVKEESVSGTAETLANADADIRVIDPVFSMDVTNLERAIVSSSLSEWGKVTGNQRCTITFSTEIVGPGNVSPFPIPSWGKLLEASGFGKTSVGSPTVTGYQYAPISTGLKTYTVGVYRDGVRFRAAGCRAQFSIRIAAGDIAYIDWTFEGKFEDVADATILSPTYESTVPKAVKSASFAVDGVSSHVVGTIGIDVNNNITLKGDVNSASGFAEAIISRRQITGNIDPCLDDIATYNFISKMTSDNQGAFTITIGSGTGETVTITAPKVMYSSWTEADIDGFAAQNVGLAFARNSADDELIISFS